MVIKSPQDVSHTTRDRIASLITQLKGASESQFVLNEALSPQERKVAEKFVENDRLRRRLERVRSGKSGTAVRDVLPHCVDIYCHVRAVPKIVAILDLSRRRKRIDPDDYDRLRRELGIDPFDRDVKLLQAVNEADLVLHESFRLLVWRRNEVEFEGQKTLWTYVWRLCHSAASGRPIDSRDFWADTQPRNLADWKSRLGKLQGFPADLWTRIHVADGRHKLDVEPNEIRMLALPDHGAIA